MNDLRDIRESKNLSKDAVAAVLGVSGPVYARIEAGTGRTTDEEVEKARKALAKMKDGTRKLVGRPFKDKAKQAAVIAARETGTSVSSVLAASNGGAPAPTTTKTVTKRTTKKAAAATK